MDKPVKRSRPAIYDYHECRDWLETKYGYKERDFLQGSVSRRWDRPAKDFWHFVCDTYEPNNGCEMVMFEELIGDIEDWQREILNYYLLHFGEGEIGTRTAIFWVEW